MIADTIHSSRVVLYLLVYDRHLTLVSDEENLLHRSPPYYHIHTDSADHVSLCSC